MLFGCSEDESGTILPAIDIRYDVWALEEISDMKVPKGWYAENKGNSEGWVCGRGRR